MKAKARAALLRLCVTSAFANCSCESTGACSTVGPELSVCFESGNSLAELIWCFS